MQGIVAKKLQHDMRPRDAVIRFHCSEPDFVQVSEAVHGGRIHHREVQRHPRVVAEMDEKYIFFANQADNAKRKIMHGQSCVFNVYFREP